MPEPSTTVPFLISRSRAIAPLLVQSPKHLRGTVRWLSISTRCIAATGARRSFASGSRGAGLSGVASVTSFAGGDVRGFLHRPNAAAGRGLVVAHGAGGKGGGPPLGATAGA